MRSVRTGGMLTVLATTAILCGCEMLDRVTVDDGHAPLVAGSIVARPDSMKYGSSGRIRGGIEVGYERQLAEGTQRLDANHYVSFDSDAKPFVVGGSNRLSGPQVIRNRVSIEHGHIAYNALFSLGGFFEFEPSLGIGYDEMLVSSSGLAASVGQPPPGSTPVEFTKRKQAWGATAGVVPRWNFSKFAAIEARARYGVGDNVASSLYGGAVVLRPIPNIELSGGYLWRQQEIELPDYVSNIRFKVHGPLVAVRFVF